MLKKFDWIFKNWLFLLVLFFIIAVSVIVKQRYSKTELSVKEAASQIDAICNKETTDVCYANKLSRIAEEQGPVYAFRVLRVLTEMQEENPEVDLHYCHDIAHGIARATFPKLNKFWREHLELAGMVTIECDSGYLHGILEQLFTYSPGNLSPDIEIQVCGEAPLGPCVHHLGHFVYVDYQRNLSLAMDFCSRLKSSYDCFSGLFSEYFNLFQSVEHNPEIERKPKDVNTLRNFKEICEKQKEEAYKACWFQLGTVVIQVFNNDIYRAFSFCDEARTSESKIRCKERAFSYISYEEANFDSQKAHEACKVMSSGNYSFLGQCYDIYVNEVLQRPHGDIEKRIESAIKFCTNLDVAFRQECFRAIGGRFKRPQYADIDPNVISQGCALAPKEYRDVCDGKFE